ncbi:nucleoid-associated protein [Psychrobacter pygoscelis]|uniref:nucleoid-associated protein n=1 Tax=Psychrobacter pygoscelis TaxID=2488563 RepID=UPI0013F41AEF|nr:nucleoid-associated protein [Psychrobacter pygoscelis]
MIKRITYHALLKEQGSTDNVSIVLNPNKELPEKESTTGLLKELIDRYHSTAGKSYGVFEEDEDIYQTPKILRTYLTENDDFYKATEHLMRVLMNKSKSQVFTKGGVVIFFHYEEENKDYLIIAILSEKVAYIAKDWDLAQVEALNYENVRFAGRINLTDWLDESSDTRYISFLRGKGDVSAYFKEFIGCNNTSRPLAETRALVSYIEKFGEEQNLNLDDLTAFKNKAEVYLKDLANESTPFALQVFANVLWPSEPQDLIDSLEENGKLNNLPISDGFIPDKRPLKALRVYACKTKHWSISFDVTAWDSGDVEVDPVNNKIIFHNPPPALINPFRKRD